MIDVGNWPLLQRDSWTFFSNQMMAQSHTPSSLMWSIDSRTWKRQTWSSEKGHMRLIFYFECFSYWSIIIINILFYFIWKQVKTRLEEFSYSEDRYRALLAIRQNWAFCLKCYSSIRDKNKPLRMLRYSEIAMHCNFINFINGDMARQNCCCWCGYWW